MDKLSRRMSIGFSMTFLAVMLFIVSLVQGLLIAFIIVVIAELLRAFFESQK
ncbi:MAG: hypothetical protein ACTSUN_00945 [Promethearchaeota archaeon]